MMQQFIVDAFTEKIFCGNPAAVCILKNFPDDEIMLKIAQENNLSETAFAVKGENNFYKLRWFTPSCEIDFCGHATLATAFMIFTQIEKNLNSVEFETLRGKFSVTKRENFFEMNFPAYEYKKIPVTDEMSAAIGEKVLEAYFSRDLLMVLESDEKVKNLRPDFEKLKNLDGLIQAVTAKSSDKNFDCVSRVFAPKIKIPEDPVTGSTHCLIAPIWSEKLSKNILKCYQASERGGNLICEISGDRVKISGSAVLFAQSELNI
ncbi:MAG: PhzF family phenazine biosynthesis protein [Selenomonadaceae bacterium]|nr:PhzF family phenazine biosynthesis protein [Selenomonadaceae bacterium]